MKTRRLLMLAGLAGAAWLAIFGDKSPDTGLAVPVAHQPAMPGLLAAAAPSGADAARNPAHTEAEPGIARGEGEIHIMDLQSRAELMGVAENVEEGEELFSSKSWEPPAPLAAINKAPPPPPVAPPLPFTYLGKQTAGGRLEVYLASGDKVFVVREQAVILNNYRVESIRPPAMSLVYLPLNQVQQLSIGVAN